jgi:hypothetical protein
MTVRKINVLLIVFLLTVFPVFPQNDNASDSGGDSEEKQGQSLFLIPILETAFSGSVDWRPDWPSQLPPDAFNILQDKDISSIEASDGTETLTVKYENGRLTAFPYFYADMCAKVEAVYDTNGAVKSMNIINKKIFSQDDSGDDASNGESDEQEINITFPPNFLPYGNLSPGGSFPPITVMIDDDTFFVFIYETQAFLTETWYNSDGAMTVFCKALIQNDCGKWRIRTLQIYQGQDVSFIDYFYYANGKVSEIRSEESAFQAIYNRNRVTVWNMADQKQEMEWDYNGFLTVVKVTQEAADASYIEYRYDYEYDSQGNWTKRTENAFVDQFGLLVPQPSSSRGIWDRLIAYR